MHNVVTLAAPRQHIQRTPNATTAKALRAARLVDDFGAIDALYKQIKAKREDLLKDIKAAGLLNGAVGALYELQICEETTSRLDVPGLREARGDRWIKQWSVEGKRRTVKAKRHG